MKSGNTTPRLDRSHFAERWTAIGATHSRAYGELERRYAEAHRAYHNAEHIAECLGWLERVTHLASRPAELAIAVYFHDAVYDPSAADNEGQSAALFRALASQADIDLDVQHRISTLIESTATHDRSNGDAALLSDVDLAILGSSPTRYAAYADAIRREYSVFPDASYRAGRTRVLETFLGRIAIYQTPAMAALLEAQARNNLARELIALRS